MLGIEYESDAIRRFGQGGVFLSLLFATPVFLLVYTYDGLGRARAAALCTAVAFAVAMLRWRTSKRRLTLFAVGAALTIQVVTIFVLPLGGESLPAYALLPATVVIYLLDEGVVHVLSRTSSTGPK